MECFQKVAASLMVEFWVSVMIDPISRFTEISEREELSLCVCLVLLGINCCRKCQAKSFVMMMMDVTVG
jgi:hypothetical protein